MDRWWLESAHEGLFIEDLSISVQWTYIYTQVYLPTIEGHVLSEMIQALYALIDFVCVAQHDIIDSDDLDTLDDVLEQFHKYHESFWECSICPTGFNLSRQHSHIHYHRIIWAFSALNGLCSSITESKHIKAVKEPWQCSNYFEALSQMLWQTNGLTSWQSQVLTLLAAKFWKDRVYHIFSKNLVQLLWTPCAFVLTETYTNDRAQHKQRHSGWACCHSTTKWWCMQHCHWT